jgi:hypothetical protein
LSHQRKRKGKKKKKSVWRQFCECLSEAAAHLLATVSQLLLEALWIAVLRSELNTHLAPQALFRVLLGVTATFTNFPLSKHTAEVVLYPPSPVGLFIYSSCVPSPPPVEFSS